MALINLTGNDRNSQEDNEASSIRSNFESKLG